MTIDSFLTQLTPKVKADLPRWYGVDAKLVGDPVIQPRDWSFFFRYLVQVSKDEQKVVLVKVRHLKNMNIDDAVNNETLRNETQTEYATLVQLREVFAEKKDFATIRPLALYEKLNAFAAEEADIHMLLSDFQSPAVWLNEKKRQQIETDIKNAGRWLRIFHQHFAKQEKQGALFDEKHYNIAQEYLQTIQGQAKKIDFAPVETLLQELYEKYAKVKAPHVSLHEDFSLSNVFITPNHQVCSFDSKQPSGSAYFDIAKFIADMHTCLVQVLTFGLAVPAKRVKKLRSAFLSGYFEDSPANLPALELYHLFYLLEKWAEREISLRNAVGVKKIVYSIFAPQMRRYHWKLLRVASCFW